MAELSTNWLLLQQYFQPFPRVSRYYVQNGSLIADVAAPNSVLSQQEEAK